MYKIARVNRLSPFVAFKMSWRSHGTDNKDLVHQLRENRIIAIDSVAKAMEQTDRKFYCPKNSYIDAPQSIGCDVTISAPHMHAYALELLADKLRPGASVLDVGSGSGYLTACFARHIGNGTVIGVEHQPQLVALGIENIRKDDASLLDTGLIKIIQGDGRLGCSEYAPFDAIHVGAAAPDTPHELINQLKNGGRLIVPIGPINQTQSLEQFEKNAEGVVVRKSLMSVMYVPLTDLKTD